MTYDFAPMEGVTDAHFRSIHYTFLKENAPDGIPDRYFAPFYSPAVDVFTYGIEEKPRRELAPENNAGFRLIPQILSNNAAVFVKTCSLLSEYGYHEYNLNLGCPSGTVVSKHKGSGFLEDTDALDRFFDSVFSSDYMKSADAPQISVKTRLGVRDVSEFEQILAVYNRYPLSEIILHPRVRMEYYKGEPHTDVFLSACQNSVHPLCYNGNIFTNADAENLQNAVKDAGFGEVSVMIGRGLVSNPCFLSELRGGKPLDKPRLYRFYKTLLDDATERLSGERHTLFRMKELFAYWIPLFSEESRKPYEKRIRKTMILSEFRSAADALFENCPLKENAGFSGNAKL